MTREYAVEMIKAIKNGLHETGKDFPYRDEIIPIAKEALEVAIIELQQEPCDDAISRQAAIDAIFAEPLYKLGMKKRYAEEAVPAIFEKIKALPPVTPQYTEAEIQKMQELEQAEIQKAYEIGKAESGSENPNKWIPVSERYPEDGQHILFSTKTGCVFEGRYSADTSAHNWLSYKDDTYAWNNVVTAWMPLPEPYKASPTGAESEE